jgi:glyoxylase-like metal-dependent hydrolase (beta-lactamase superfamily II)
VPSPPCPPVVAFGQLPATDPGQPSVAIATCVTDTAQVRNVALLLDSLRRFGGPIATAPVVVGFDESVRVPTRALERPGVRLVPLEAPPEARDYPYAYKAYAASRAEEIVAGSADTLIWLDAEILVLAPPTPLVLDAGHAVAMRPVYLRNAIGLAPDQPTDAFWAAILADNRLEAARLPVVETEVDTQKVRGYFNCGAIAVRPSLGLFREWARQMSARLADADYQRRACADGLHRVFLHQAVLSAIIVARTSPAQWRWLPRECGYPLHLHARLPAELRAARLADLSVVLHENEIDQPGALDGIEVNQELRAFLDEQLRRRLHVTERILREEGACNAYVLTTASGNVAIDPGGARDPGSRLLAEARRAPLQAVLLTHAHDDHRGSIALWRPGHDVPVIAQQGHAELIEHHEMLSAFYSRRVSAQRGETARVPEDTSAERVLPTVTFDDRHEFRVGDLECVMLHTPGETPDAATVWVPQLRAAFVGDLVFGSFPTLYTLRGTRPRWALEWARSLDRVLALEPEVLLPGHEEPTLGREEVRQLLTRYRDAILAVRRHRERHERGQGRSHAHARGRRAAEFQLPSTRPGAVGGARDLRGLRGVVRRRSRLDVRRAALGRLP